MVFGLGISNPGIQQGFLNRVLTHILVPAAPQLNVSASFMSKNLSKVTFDEDANDQIPTATGVVNSPKPFIMATLVVNILRSQTLANLYFAAIQGNCLVGDITVYSDSTVLSQFTFGNASLQHLDPGAFDGQDPTIAATFKGVFNTNSILWTPAT